ncbi:MAG: alpha/beta fold hydrolase [Comamonadaceae bacterium]|nr:MAG: alpha/beta fold hydrolase [Comamonadaceae bacterium]
MNIKSSGIQIEIADTHPDGGRIEGGGARPVVLLIMGLGMQLIAWPPELVSGLVAAGYRVVRFDNRDVGLSEKFSRLGTPNLMWEGLKFRFGLNIRPPYSLSDMAADSLGVLDALGIAEAHVAGVSMGGMIAQRLAALAPGRVASLTSIMSSSGARGLPGPQPQVTRALLTRPRDKSVEAAVENTARLLKIIGSPAFPTADAELRENVAAAAARNFNPPGVVRQMVAIAADGTRAAALAKITAPTLVIHGSADPLLPFACGEDTARRIPGATLEAIPGMGHDLPPPVVKRVLPLLLSHFSAARPDPKTENL